MRRTQFKTKNSLGRRCSLCKRCLFLKQFDVALQRNQLFPGLPNSLLSLLHLTFTGVGHFDWRFVRGCSIGERILQPFMTPFELLKTNLRVVAGGCE